MTARNGVEWGSVRVTVSGRRAGLSKLGSSQNLWEKAKVGTVLLSNGTTP